jgi:hypothetical protein
LQLNSKINPYWIAGYCRDDGECICNEETLDIEERIKSVLGGMTIQEWVEDKIAFFEGQVDGLEISAELKKIFPSRCQISDT